MRPISLTALTVATIAANLTGCAAHHVRINAYRSHDLAFPVSSSQPTPSIAVVAGSEPREPLLEAEVARKVGWLVRNLGYRAGDEATADFVLTVWVSIDNGETETVLDTNYASPHYGGSYVYTHGGRWTGLSSGGGRRTNQLSYSYTYFTRSCWLTLYDRAMWQDASDQEVGEAAIWTCTSVSRGTSSDLRSMINFLLAGAFDHFGDDTGRELRIGFNRNDPHVAKIAATGHGEPPQ